MEGLPRPGSSIHSTPIPFDNPTEEQASVGLSPNQRVVRPRSPSLGEDGERPATSYLSLAEIRAATQERAATERDDAPSIQRRKVRKTAATQQPTSSRRTRETGESKSSGLGFVFGMGSRNGALLPLTHAPAPVSREQTALPPEGTWISEAAFAALRASGVNVIDRGSSSDGRVQVGYGPAPLAAPMEPAQHAEQVAPEEPHPRARAAIEHKASPAFDPVESVTAKVMRAQLRKLLRADAAEGDIYYKALRPYTGVGQVDLIAQRQAFSLEFLVAVLLVLPDADPEQAKRLGHALARKRTAGLGHGWGLTAATRTVIGQALAHPTVQERAPLDRLLALLTGANEKGARQDKDGGHNALRNQYTRNTAAFGIPQALAKRLVLEAQAATAAGSDLTAVLDVARDLGTALTRPKRRADTTSHEVVAEIRKSSLPDATKRQLESRFVIGYEGLADEVNPADLSGDGGGDEPARAEE